MIGICALQLYNIDDDHHKNVDHVEKVMYHVCLWYRYQILVLKTLSTTTREKYNVWSRSVILYIILFAVFYVFFPVVYSPSQSPSPPPAPTPTTHMVETHPDSRQYGQDIVHTLYRYLQVVILGKRRPSIVACGGGPRSDRDTQNICNIIMFFSV